MALEWVLYDLHFQLWQNVASLMITTGSHLRLVAAFYSHMTIICNGMNSFGRLGLFNHTILLTTMICLITAMKNVIKMSPFTWVP